MNKEQIKVTFHGGTGWVTGANFLLEREEKKHRSSTMLTLPTILQRLIFSS
jgi:hypothetical protein